MKLLLDVILLIVGFYGLIKGADIFVVGASKVAQKFHIPMLVIGLTIVAMGTSAPEAAISITAAFENSSGITIGNIVGSNILNILLILGICACIQSLKVNRSTYHYEIPFVIFITTVLFVLGWIGSGINRFDAMILTVLFIAFLGYLFRLAKNGNEDESEDIVLLEEKDTFPRLIFLIVLGLILIIVGSQFTVESAKSIAASFGVSERVIGLTIVAFGTSLPELITSVTAVRKGNNEIAIGNIVGSNIFNILFVLGIAGLVSPVAIPYSQGFLVDTVVAIFAAVLLFITCGKKLTLNRSSGIIMLVSYAVYFVFLMLK